MEPVFLGLANEPGVGASALAIAERIAGPGPACFMHKQVEFGLFAVEGGVPIIRGSLWPGFSQLMSAERSFPMFRRPADGALRAYAVSNPATEQGRGRYSVAAGR